MKFDLELLGNVSLNGWDSAAYYRDVATDVMYIQVVDSVCVMMDPETGKPLTYAAYMQYAQRKGMVED